MMRGAVTVEAALAIAALVVVLLLCLGGVTAVVGAGALHRRRA